MIVWLHFNLYCFFPQRNIFEWTKKVVISFHDRLKCFKIDLWFQSEEENNIFSSPGDNFTNILRTRFFIQKRISLVTFGLVIFWRRKTLMKLTAGVNFTNIVWAAFTHEDHKSAKKTLMTWLFFCNLGSLLNKAACKMLAKLTPVADFTNILHLTFAQIVFWQKNIKPNCIWRQAVQNTFFKKSCSLVKLTPGVNYIIIILQSAFTPVDLHYWCTM